MATVTKWNPFGVALNITATGSNIQRTASDKFTVTINASWETYYDGAQTNYGMSASSGGATKTISSFGTKRSSGTDSFTGTYSISGNGAATKTITVTFKNYEENYQGDVTESATKSVSFNVNVPAWTSYKITYNANGGAGAPAAQTKWKNQALTLSATKPTKTGHTFLGWSTSISATSATYAAGGTYPASNNANATLYAVWKAYTYQVKYNANGGTGAPATQTKTYGKTLTLSTVRPTQANHTFLGWNPSYKASAPTYQPGGAYTANADITLYAMWELNYVKPAISNLTITRGQYNDESKFEPSEDGTLALVEFDWTSTLADPIAVFNWSIDGSAWASGTYDDLLGYSGHFSASIAGFDDSEITYELKLTLSDERDSDGTKIGGSYSVSGMLYGANYTVDGLEGGNGVAFGKPAELKGYMDVNYKAKFRKPVDDFVMSQRHSISGIRPDDADVAAGQPCEAFQPQNENGNTVIGWGNYDNKSGNTNVYGYDVIYGVSNIPNPGTYRGYRRRGDSFTLTIRTAGYVTSSKQHVHFRIPVSEPIIGQPTITVTSGSGFTLRQGDAYTHGSSSTTSVAPDSYEATYSMLNGIEIKAVFSDTTNATNNDTIGIYWNGTITLS